MADAFTGTHEQAEKYAYTLDAHADTLERRPTPEPIARIVEPMIIAACRAGAAALRAEQGWQPIASAPKDADLILLYLDGSGVQPGYWDDDCWLAVETQGLTGGRWHANPTHWMPLPSPPSRAEQGRQIEEKDSCASAHPSTASSADAGTEPRLNNYYVELRYGRYYVIDGKTERIDSASIYQGLHTKESVESGFWPAYQIIARIGSAPLASQEHAVSTSRSAAQKSISSPPSKEPTA